MSTACMITVKRRCRTYRWRRLSNLTKYHNEQGFFMGPAHWQVCPTMSFDAQIATRAVAHPHVLLYAAMRFQIPSRRQKDFQQPLMLPFAAASGQHARRPGA